MTKEEARKIIENCEKLKPSEKKGVVYYLHLGDFFWEYRDAFGFAVYPYSEKEPLDPEYAFKYFVDKETGEVSSASAPMDDWELELVKPPEITLLR